MSRPVNLAAERLARQRAWLEFVIESAIDLLDQLDREIEDLEDDELGDDMAVCA